MIDLGDHPFRELVRAEGFSEIERIVMEPPPEQHLGAGKASDTAEHDLQDFSDGALLLAPRPQRRFQPRRGRRPRRQIKGLGEFRGSRIPIVDCIGRGGIFNQLRQRLGANDASARHRSDSQTKRIARFGLARIEYLHSRRQSVQRVAKRVRLATVGTSHLSRRVHAGRNENRVATFGTVQNHGFEPARGAEPGKGRWNLPARTTQLRSENRAGSARSGFPVHLQLTLV